MPTQDWRALIERLPLDVYIDRLDEWSSNIYTSPRLEAILGYKAEEGVGENHLLLKTLHPDDRERVCWRRTGARARPASPSVWSTA